MPLAAGLNDDGMDITAPLNSRIVVVTGAGTGIGRATARAFAAEGAHVIALGRRVEPLDVAVQAGKERAHVVQGQPGGQQVADVAHPHHGPLVVAAVAVAAVPPSDKGLRIALERLAILNERIATQTEARDRLEKALREKAGHRIRPVA